MISLHHKSLSFFFSDNFISFNSVLSILAYLCKAPLVERSSQVINVLSRQRAQIENFLRALLALPPVDNLYLQNKVQHLSQWHEKPTSAVF